MSYQDDDNDKCQNAKLFKLVEMEKAWHTFVNIFNRVKGVNATIYKSVILLEDHSTELNIIFVYL